MSNRIQEAFVTVKAGEGLKEQTLCAIESQRPGERWKPNRLWISRSRRLRPVLSACCVLLMVAGSLGTYHVYDTEAAVISIDINPSIELDVNRFGLVIGQTAYGEEAQEVLSSLSLKNLKYDEAVEKLLTSPGLEPYLTEGATVTVTLGSEDPEGAAMLNQLESCVNEVIESHHQGVSSSYCHVDMEEAEAAHHAGMSVGTYCSSHHGQDSGCADPGQGTETQPQEPLEQDENSQSIGNGCSHHHHGNSHHD